MQLLKEFLYKIADDMLIIGHRNGEWTGLGPILEEDIAFSSMAQDKIGQAQAVYNILHELGEQDADTIAFMRNANQFHCCNLVELPIGEYDFSLVRHFLFDHADQLRWEMLATSSFEPITKLAKKFRGEIKYHVMHADVWMKQLGNANEEAHARMQNSLNETFNLALGIFEESEFENEIISEKIFAGEKNLKEKWLENISKVLVNSSLVFPAENTWQPILGGRKGKHTEHLQPLLNEMTEVYRIEPNAEW